MWFKNKINLSKNVKVEGIKSKKKMNEKLRKYLKNANIKFMANIF
jgi:hypothetical protein